MLVNDRVMPTMGLNMNGGDDGDAMTTIITTMLKVELK